MPKLFAEFREENPQYAEVSDVDLAKALHKKYYADVPYKDFVQAAVKKAYPAPDFQAAEDAAVKAVADELNPLERGIIGFRESTRTAAGRIAGLLGNEEAQAQAERERDLTRHVTGGSALAGRLFPIIAATSRVPGGVAPSAAAGTVSGALTADDPTTGAVAGGLGGAGGALLGGAIGRGANALRGKWADRVVQGADDTSQYIRDFQEMGGRLTPGQASGGPIKGMLDNAMTSNPITASAYRGIADQNKKLVTRLAGKVIGTNVDDLGPTALRNADDFISKQFNNVADQIDSVPLPAGMGDDLIVLLRKGDVKPYLAQINKGSLTGRAYMNLRSKLLNITRGSSDKVDDAWAAIDDLDEIVEGVAPPGYKEAYAAARERYKVMLALDKYRRGVSGGEVNPSTLEGAFEKVFRKQYTRDLDTVLPETKQLFTALRTMADPRMNPHLFGSPTAERLAPWLIASGAALNPALAGLFGAGWVGSRAALAAGSPLAAQAGGVAGRTVPTILDAVVDLNKD